MKTELCWDATPIALCALVKGSDVAKQGLSCQWQKKTSWFQLCQWTVDGHGQPILPEIFSSLAYSVLPACPLAFCQATLFLQENFDSPFLCGAGPFLSALHLWQFLQNTPGITELSDQDREISHPPVQPVFPVLMLLFQLVQVFPCAVWCMKEIWDCSSYIYRYSCWTSNSSVSFSAYKT